MAFDLIKESVPPRSRVEHVVYQKNNVRVWFCSNCKPLPGSVISGKRLWEYHRMSGNKPTIRAFYQIARQVLLEEPFVSSNSNLVKTPEGLVFVNLTLKNVDHLIENERMKASDHSVEKTV